MTDASDKAILVRPRFGTTSWIRVWLIAVTTVSVLAGGRATAHARSLSMTADAKSPTTRKRTAAADRQSRTARRGTAATIYWGATIGSQITGEEEPENMKAVSVFARNARKAPSIVHFFYPLAKCDRCQGLPFPAQDAQSIRDVGAIPLISWMGDSDASSTNDPRFALSTVLDGRWDSEIRTFAEGAKSWGHPFFLRLDPEMNGNWLPWGTGTAGNTPSQFVAAWRHIYRIFQSVGARNATWVWCPNVGSSQAMAADYPGNRYVNWTCLDGYNWGTNPSSSNAVNQWLSFTSIFSSSYKALVQIAPHKPIMIGEFATSAWGGYKTQWLGNALSTIPAQFPHVHAAVYFDRDEPGGMDWELESDPAYEAAFARGVSQPAYAANSFANLPASPIPALP